MTILERLKSATGADTNLDEAIFQWRMGRQRRISTFEQYDPSEDLPAVTSSIDACLYLINQWFPKHFVEIYRGQVSPENWRCGLQNDPRKDQSHAIFGHAPTAPLAMLIAFFEAVKRLAPDNTPGDGDKTMGDA